MVIRNWDNSSANGEIFDYVRFPAMTTFQNTHTHNALRRDTHRLGLHAFHGEFARIVEGLGVVCHFYVLSDCLHCLAQAHMRNVVDTTTHHHAHRTVASAQQGPEILAAQIGGERQTAHIAKTLAT